MRDARVVPHARERQPRRKGRREEIVAVVENLFFV